MTETLAPIIDATTVERVMLHGDLKQLTSSQKVSYYRAVCESVGLNPLTQPFQYLVLNGKEILYARREATEQLRQIHSVSIEIRARELVDEIYVVTARATLPGGRTDENIGAVPIGPLKGEARANAMMKAETKAKRRVTLAICGLGLLDETEVDSLPPTVAVRSEAPVIKEPPRALEHAPMQDPELPMGVVRVVKFEQEPTKNPNVTRFIVTFSNGELLTTINSFLGTLAQDAHEKQTPVRITTRSTRWGSELVTLKPADEPELPLEPPPLDSEIPF
jgi:hypothetical protein